MAATAGEEAIHFPAVKDVHVEDVTGAGDAFVSGLLHGHMIGASFAGKCPHGTSECGKDFGELLYSKT